ncbi:MAG: cysteine desulfurase [Gammaproteobacteria bacterium]|nr:cysteine desulfurase [Gammaproteobacteria bacterium]
MAVYLDYNATTPLDPRVLEAMLPYLTSQRGNPSSVHRYGRAARQAIDNAREQVAALVRAHPSEVIFTSGGTEANNTALQGAAARLAPGRIAVSAVEHSSVLAAARALTARGWRLDTIAVDGECRVTLPALRARLKPDTRLVSVMMANNETGAVQDIAAIGRETRAAGAIMHTDAVQAAGKIALDFEACGAHLMSLSAHKLYGPQGVGALIVDKSVDLEPLLHGGGQEKNRRGGTENVAGIVGFGAAAELAVKEGAARAAVLRGLRDHLEASLRALPPVVIFAERIERLPNTVQLSVPGIDGETLLMALDRKGIAVSSGSACASGSVEPSHVLMAMGVERELARGAIRVSLGKENTRADVDAFISALREIIDRLPAARAG